MKITFDTETNKLTQEENGTSKTMDLYSDEAFEIISHHWVKTGWNQKYPYSFSWMGRPVIQLPEDMIRIQEVIYNVKPDVVIETGIAHGGSLIYYASILKAMGKGKVVGIDIDIREHNRKEIEAHELYSYITMYEGSSIDPEIVEKVRSEIKPGDKVLVLLDSNHLKGHVYEELKAYNSMVTPGSYIVATDGLMEYVYDVPRGTDSWKQDNPVEAVNDFLKESDDFVLEQPAWPFNESTLTKNITHWPSAYLKRK
ncbi:hydroxylase [Halobacteriovorax marinus]|uniref:Hydroxylase n=1 Tax=Halobacteriovorax marinus TaxID=97084 RepID=A0A1Y5FB06_9BACT|nr:hydroxylase [Halobacteriovorax marinus]